MTVKHYIGWDMGGAHLKMAHIDQAGVVRNVEQHLARVGIAGSSPDGLEQAPAGQQYHACRYYNR